MKRLKVVVSLVTRDNDYQREQAAVAEATGLRLGMDVQVMFADNDAIEQTKQILAHVHAPQSERPDAVIVEPVGTGMPGVAGAATGSGIGWVVLNREAEYLQPLRQNTSVPVGSVGCDNVEVGRIQARQFAALLPGGGPVLYIEGPAVDTAKQRRAGLMEVLPANIFLKPTRGKWTEESAFQIVSSRLQLAAKHAPEIGLIGCQNDAMAMGARRAVEAMTTGELREQWLRIPFTGVDGVPASGKAWVQKGLLAATIIAPALTGLALELVSRSIATGTQMPERTLTQPISFPTVQELSERVTTVAAQR